MERTTIKWGDRTVTYVERAGKVTVWVNGVETQMSQDLLTRLANEARRSPSVRVIHNGVRQDLRR
jgi:hypothetical protein